MSEPGIIVIVHVECEFMKKCLMFPPETCCLPLSGLPLIFLNITTVQLQWSNLEMEHKLSIFLQILQLKIVYIFLLAKIGINPMCIFPIHLKVYFIPLIITSSYYKAMIDKHNLLTYYTSPNGWCPCDLGLRLATVNTWSESK